MEKNLLKLFLKQDFYNIYNHLIKEDTFAGDYGFLYKIISETHKKYSSDITESELRAIVSAKRLSGSKHNLIDKLITDIISTPDGSPEIAVDLLKSAKNAAIARQIAVTAVALEENKAVETFEKIKVLLEQADCEDTTTITQQVPTSLEELLECSKAGGLWSWSMSALSERVPSIGPMMNVIIFGRPEVGKSSFIAAQVVGFLRQGAKVLYIANEEPGFKVMLNLVRNALKESDKGLEKLTKEKKKAWTDIKDRIIMLDTADNSIGDIERWLAEFKPDILVLDQTDKISAQSRFDAGHERLKDLYVRVRLLARKYMIACINVSQASADAEGQQYVPYHMLDMSKTGKAGEADVIIGIGKDPMREETNVRYLTVSKNKLPGGGWHGMITCIFSPEHNIWEGA